MIISRIQDLRDANFTIPEDILVRASAYIKNIFAMNRRPYCLDIDCSYSFEERSNMITAVLDSNPSDYDAYKMYQVLMLDVKTRSNQIGDLTASTIIAQYGTA